LIIVYKKDCLFKKVLYEPLKKLLITVWKLAKSGCNRLRKKKKSWN